MEGPRGDFEPLQLLIDILYRSTKSGRLRSNGKAKRLYVGLKEVIVTDDTRGSFVDESSWDEEGITDDEVCECLAVCLFDIGEFVRHYPNGRQIIMKQFVGAKKLIMQYIEHPRIEVQEQALICASKLLVRNWKAIGSN